MRFGKGLSTLKNCTVAEGKQNKEMENSYAKGNRIWKRYAEKEKEKDTTQKEK
jgi:hypothetical protein